MKETNEEQQLLTIQDVTVRLGICRRTIEREIQRSRFAPPLKVGNSSRWSRTDIDAYLALLENERTASKDRISAAWQAGSERRKEQIRLRTEKRAAIRELEIERHRARMEAERLEWQRKYAEERERLRNRPLPLP